MTSLALVFAAALVLPPDATCIRLDANRWPSIVAAKDAAASEGETVWWWSTGCAPQKLDPNQRADCRPVRQMDISVHSEKQQAAAGATIVWGTEEMLGDLPDAMLPAVRTAADGTARLSTPAGETIRLRVDGPEFSTDWQRIPASARDAALEAHRTSAVTLRLKSEDGSAVVAPRAALLPDLCATLCPDRLLTFGREKQPLRFFAKPGAVYRLVVWSDSHAPLQKTLTIGGSGEIETVLTPASLLEARIVGPDKKPAAKASIAVTYLLPTLKEAIVRKVVSGSDGRFVVTGLPPAPVQWTVTADGFARRVGSVSLGRSPLDLGDVPLERARHVRVAVTDESGQPVASARVVPKGSTAVSTNSKGIAELTEIPATDVELHIQAAGFLPLERTLPKNQTAFSAVLSRGAVIRAQLIRETDGKPPEQVNARITNEGTESLRKIDTRQGFVLSGLRAGTARVRISADAARPFDTGSLTLTAGTVVDLGTIILGRGASVHGVVIDESRNAVANARVRLLGGDGDSPALARALGSWREATTGDDGSFAISGLRNGSALLIVEAEGFAIAARPNVSVDGDTSDLDAGTIELSAGRAVQLSCRPIAKCGSQAAVLPAGRDYPFVAITAPLQDGRGSLYRVPAGENLLRLTRGQQIVHERQIDVHSGSGPEVIQIQLPTVTVHGTVRIGGSPASGGSLLFTRSTSSAGPPILIRSQTGEGSSLGGEWIGDVGVNVACPVDPSGLYATAELDPADYDVVFRSNGGATAAVRVTVRDTADQLLDLQFNDGQLRGTVLTNDGKPAVARIEVTTADGQALSAWSGMDGRFQILGVRRGHARIKATAAGRSATKDVEVRDDAGDDIVLRLSENETDGVEVFVEDPSGRAVTGALVFSSAPGGMNIASTDSEGRAVLHPASATDAAFAVAAYRPGAEWSFGIGSTRAPVRLRMPLHAGRLIVKTKSGGAVTIFSPEGFPLDRVLPMTGATPQLPPAGMLQVAGLPPGTYTVASGGLRQTAVITGDETATVEFK